MLRDDSATGTAPRRSDGETAHKKSGSAARARSVATAPRLTRARTVATGLSAVVQPADVSDVLAASFSGALRSHGSPPLRVSSWTKSPSVSPSLVARFHPHSSLFLHTLSPSLLLFLARSPYTLIASTCRACNDRPMLTRTTAAFPRRKRRLPRARYCEGVGDGDKAFSPAFPGVPLSFFPCAPCVVARARFYALSSR